MSFNKIVLGWCLIGISIILIGAGMVGLVGGYRSTDVVSALYGFLTMLGGIILSAIGIIVYISGCVNNRREMMHNNEGV